MPSASSLYLSTYKGQVFTASVDPVTTSVAANTTYTGLCLTNPKTSTVNLVVSKVGFAFKVAFSAASTIGIMVGSNTTAVTQTTPITPISNRVGQGLTSNGLAASAVTFPSAPTLAYVLGAGLTAAITTTPFGESNFVDLSESIILPPGSYAALYTSTASGTNSTACSITWEEVPR